jgi:hypothetical protein
MTVNLRPDACLIGGAWIANGPSFPVRNSADNSLIATVPDLGADGARAAIAAAAAAFPGWAAKSTHLRAETTGRGGSSDHAVELPCGDGNAQTSRHGLDDHLEIKTVSVAA